MATSRREKPPLVLIYLHRNLLGIRLGLVQLRGLAPGGIGIEVQMKSGELERSHDASIASHIDGQRAFAASVAGRLGKHQDIEGLTLAFDFENVRVVLSAGELEPVIARGKQGALPLRGVRQLE